MGKSKFGAAKFTVYSACIAMMMARRSKHVVLNKHIQKAVLMEINTDENTTQHDATIQYLEDSTFKHTHTSYTIFLH
jgi:hypothetical protein